MSAQVIRFPTVGALRCPVDAEAFRDTHQLPLHPGALNSWVMGVRVAESASASEVGELVRRIFQAWLPLFPGRIQVLNVSVGKDVDGAAGVVPPFQMRGPTRVVRVDFSYDGPATSMGWPTWVARRRERIDPLCPVQPLDTAPWIALGPGEPALVQNPLKPRPNPNEDPIDLGLPSLDLDAIGANLSSAFSGFIWTLGALAAGVLVWRHMATKPRRGDEWT